MISYFNTYFNTYFAGYFGQIADTPAVFWQALGHPKVEKLEEKKRKLIRRRIKVEAAVTQRELSFKDVDLVALDNEFRLKIAAIDARISAIKAREKRRDEEELLLLTIF